MSSPGSMKSQPSPVHLSRDHDAAVNSVDSSPMSQMRLATQAPLLTASPIFRQPLGELQRNINRQTSSKSASGNVQHPASKADDPAPKLAKGLRKAAETPIGQVVKSPDQSTTVHDLSCPVDVAKTPEKRQLLARNDHPLCNNKGPSNQAKFSLGVTEGEQMNVDMQVKFRRWRAEAAAGRYIPRRVCKIPNKQLEILASDEKWQPPLPGRDKRPGTVPIALLNELTAKADGATKQPEPVSTSHRVQDKTDVSVRKAPSTIDELQSSQEVGESQWPLSPQRKAPADLLPPDSSLPSPDCHAQDLAPSEASVNDVQSEEGHADNISNGSSYPTQAEKNRAPDTLTPTQAEARPTRQPPLQLKSPPDKKSDSRSHTRGAVTSSGVSNRQVLQKIQVSETPYPGKIMRPDPVTRGSEVMRNLQQGPDPSFVPSTYLEGTHPKLRESRRPVNPQKQVHEATGVRQQSSKRKAVESEPTASAKRVRVGVADREAQQCDPAFAPVFQDIRDYRRQALKPLTKERKRQDPARPSISGSSDRTTEQNVASEQSDLSNALNGATRPPPVSTPTTIPSSRPTSKNSLQGGFGTTFATSPVTGITVPQQLFDKFLATYVDYQGGKLYFDSAVTLLRQLRLSRNDPHPSLYDDFIWHQHHSYLPYALSSIENPLSYHTYYNQHIESPSHFAKVVTAASLDQLPRTQPDYVQKCLAGDNSANDLRHPEQLNDVEASRSLISSVSPESVQAGNPLEAQHAVPQGHCEQPEELLDPSQKSSVETWLEGTARAASPDLGTPIDAPLARSPSIMEMPPPKLKLTQEVSPVAPINHLSVPNSESRKKKKRLSVSPFAQTLRTIRRQAVGYEDEELTPFKRWAKAVLSLPGEKPAAITAKKPGPPVNIFAWR